MKRTKQILALALALIMLVALAVPAFAAAETGTITISGVKDATYSIYRIFDLESYDTEAGTYAYKVNTKWDDFVTEVSIKDVYVKVDAGYVTWVGENNAQRAAEFAALAIAYAKENNIEHDGTKTAPAGGEVKFTGLPLGYYLVDTSLGALCALNTTNPNATITEKNEQPTIEKEVKESGAWGESNDAQIGDKVEFHTTITVKKGATGYVMHDKMTEGLTLNTGDGAITVKLNNKDKVDASNYTVTTSGADGCTFEIAFKNDYIKTLAVGNTLDVYYSATLNDKAVIAGGGNENEVKLNYGDNSGLETLPDTTITKTWEINVLKYKTDKEGNKPLAGAKFKLTTDEAGNNVIKVSGSNPVYKVNMSEGKETITTDASGVFTIKGLDSGTYYLHEVEAPKGYNKLADPITITIGKDGAVTPNKTVSYDDGAAKEFKGVAVLNQAGAELPETGGIGTTIFYIVGGALMFIAVVLLITKKRMSANN